MRRAMLLALGAVTAALIGVCGSATASFAAPVPPSMLLGAFVPGSGLSTWQSTTGEASPIVENDMLFSGVPDESSFFSTVAAAGGTPFLGIICDATCASGDVSDYALDFATALARQIQAAGFTNVYLTLDPEINNPTVACNDSPCPSAAAFRTAWNTIFYDLIYIEHAPVTLVYQVSAKYASNFTVYRIADAQVLPSMVAIDLFGPAGQSGQTLTTMSCPDVSGTVSDCAQNAVTQAENKLGYTSTSIMFGSMAVGSDMLDPTTGKWVPDPSNQCAAWANLQNFSVNYNLAGFIWYDINEPDTTPNGTQYQLAQYCSP